MALIQAAILAASVFVAVPEPGDAVPEYEGLDEMPGIVVQPTRSVGRGRKGLEWSSVISLGDEILLLDDRRGPVVPAPESTPYLAAEDEAARGLALFRVVGASLEGPSPRLERAWAGAFRRDVLAPGHRFANLEAMARHGQHLYLMGSHAPRRNGSFRSERQVALRVSAGPTPSVAWRAIRLREALPPVVGEVPELEASLGSKDVEAGERDGQLAVEGMVALADSDDFLLGLRSPRAAVASSADPRCRKAALVLRLHDLPAAFDADAPPRLSVHAFLCLGDRGIAGMAWDPDSRSYLIAVSRPPGGKGATSLWQWDPRPCADPPLVERARFTHLRLEGIDRIAGGPLKGKLALAFDSHYYAGARRPEETSEGSLVVVDWELPPLCEEAGRAGKGGREPGRPTERDDAGPR